MHKDSALPTSNSYFSAQDDAQNGCKSLNLIEYTCYWMAFALVLPEEMYLFSLFPEVIYADVVKSTNNEKRPLFTMCGKTTHGKFFNIMRVFLHHEKCWYSDGCSVSLPRLFGKPTVKKLKWLYLMAIFKKSTTW